MRLIGKCLHVGVLDGDGYSEPDVGTAQGSVLSPLLGNIYLHFALDLWVESDVTPHLRGKSIFVRYCDDFIFGFERQDDAEWVMMHLRKRMGMYGLTLHPDKTRLVDFGRPSKGQRQARGRAASISSGSRCIGSGPEVGVGSWHSRPAVRA